MTAIATSAHAPRADRPGPVAEPLRMAGADTLSRVRPQPIVDEEFVAFRLKADGTMRRIITKASFEDCRNAALQVSLFGEKFAVQRTDVRTGAVTLHVFQVRREAQAKWVGGEGGRRLYADEIVVLKLEAGRA